jgi:hypothetical protein
MKPHHISELIAELQATGKLPSDKPALNSAQIEDLRILSELEEWPPAWWTKEQGKPVRRARQMKLKLN